MTSLLKYTCATILDSTEAICPPNGRPLQISPALQINRLHLPLVNCTLPNTPKCLPQLVTRRLLPQRHRIHPLRHHALRLPHPKQDVAEAQVRAEVQLHSERQLPGPEPGGCLGARGGRGGLELHRHVEGFEADEPWQLPALAGLEEVDLQG